MLGHPSFTGRSSSRAGRPASSYGRAQVRLIHASAARRLLGGVAEQGEEGVTHGRREEVRKATAERANDAKWWGIPVVDAADFFGHAAGRRASRPRRALLVALGQARGLGGAPSVVIAETMTVVTTADLAPLH